MDSLNLDLSIRCTYADDLSWTDDVRRELFDNGCVYHRHAVPRGSDSFV
jgi:hypothetical protein